MIAFRRLSSGPTIPELMQTEQAVWLAQAHSALDTFTWHRFIARGQMQAWPIPSGAHDLRQTFGVVLVGLVHLHLQRRTRMPGVETDDIKPAPTQRVHQPGRHRAGLQPYTSVSSRMTFDHPLELLRIGRALTAP